MSRKRPTNRLRVREFFGVPGVGKSYLLRTAVPASIERPMDWYRQGGRRQRLRRKVWLVLRHLPTAFATAVWARKLIGLHPPMGWRRRWMVLFNWVFVDCVIRAAARNQKSVLVLDQGITQALWSTNFGTEGDWPFEEVSTQLRQYLQRLPISEWIVIRVTARPETVQRRVEAREGFSPVDRDLVLMDEAHCAEREVSEVLTGLVRGPDSVPKIKIVNVVNEDDSAVSRLREVMVWA